MYFKDRENSGCCGNEAYVNLGNAIIFQAVKDYRAASKSLVRFPNSESAKSRVRELEQFFYSELFSAITEADPDMIIAKLKQEVELL